MVDEKKDQVVTGQGDTGQSATGQSDVSAQTVPAADDKGPVPYDRFKEVNDAKNAAEKQAKDLQQEMYRLNQYYQQVLQTSQQSTAPPGQLNIADDDYIQGRQLKDILQLVTLTVEQNTFLAQHPDFSIVVGAPNALGQFQPSQFLQNALKKDPELLRDIQANPHAYKNLYRIARAEKEIFEKDESIKKTQETASSQQNLQQTATQKTMPLSPAAIGGGGALSQAGAVASMSDEEFERTRQDVLSGKYG